MPVIPSYPKILVLLATYNGSKWLTVQIDSILNQKEVDIHLLVSDDQSSDSTENLIHTLAKEDSRIQVLPTHKRYGSPGKNFYRLLLEAEIGDYEYIALADQDDVWQLDKLKRQIDLIKLHQVDAVSTNVVAFWPNGQKILVNKAQEMRKLDFLFESAGPGCTFLMTKALVMQVKTILQDPTLPALSVTLHDWLIYTICRASGGKWHIDEAPLLKYRQHENNVIGVNFGIQAWNHRFRLITNKWYRNEVTKLAQVARTLSDDPYIQSACTVLLDHRPMRHLRLLRYMPQSRRNLAERLFLTAMVFFHLY